MSTVQTFYRPKEFEHARIYIDESPGALARFYSCVHKLQRSTEDRGKKSWHVHPLVLHLHLHLRPVVRFPPFGQIIVGNWVGERGR